MRLLSWPGPEAPLADAGLASWTILAAPALPIACLWASAYGGSVLSHLLAAEAWDSISPPCPTQMARGPVKRAPTSPMQPTYFTSFPRYTIIKMEIL